MKEGAPALTKLLWQKQLRGADITSTEYRVLLTICTYTDKALGNAHPGWARIVADARVTEKTAKKAVLSLIEKGWLRLVEAGGNQYGKGRANVYELAVPVIHKGGSEHPPSSRDTAEGRGVIHDRRGVIDDTGRGVGTTPPSGSTSIRGQIHHSDAHASGSVRPTDGNAWSDARGTEADDANLWPQQTAPTSWLDLIDDPEELEAWIESDIGLDEHERTTVRGMWDTGTHPAAIRNTIIAARRRTA